jgi:hypothetical protein
MKTVYLPRIEYTGVKDWNGTPAGTQYFSFLDVFVSNPSQNIQSRNKIFNWSTDWSKGGDRAEATGQIKSDLADKIQDYMAQHRDQFITLWSVPNLPFKTNLPTDNEPTFEAQRDNFIESLPKDIDPNFNQNLNQIKNKTPIQDISDTPFPLHPLLEQPYAPNPEVIEIDPEYPPFYNKYLDAKKKAGLV